LVVAALADEWAARPAVQTPAATAAAATMAVADAATARWDLTDERGLGVLERDKSSLRSGARLRARLPPSAHRRRASIGNAAGGSALTCRGYMATRPLGDGPSRAQGAVDRLLCPIFGHHGNRKDHYCTMRYVTFIG
jgi:hypothetical protein